MNISEVDAVEHIINSLDNTSADFWYDTDEGITWHVSTSGPGEIEFSFTDDDDEEIDSQTFRLVKI